MYSGSDSTESQNYTQWALNPSAYQNVSNEQVDWAALAQQWIIMKEAGPPVPEQATVAPTAPVISNKVKKEVLNEGGEAPMDVENEKEDVAPPQWNSSSNLPPPPAGETWNWNQQQQWGWNNSWTPPAVPPPGTVKPPLLPTPPGYNQFGPHETPKENTNFGGFNSASHNDYSSGYWTAGGTSKIKPHNKRFSKVNVPRQPPAPEPVTIDAAKRKQLPAWIREGLEKMERDKQKQMEKEREQQEKQQQKEQTKLSEEDTLEIIKSTVKEQRSKFESDGDSDDSEIRGKALTPEPVPLTQEELMLKVRRTMTEILLKVTTREIYQICKDELQRHLKKVKASDQRVSATSGTNLSEKLGLGIYGGDSDSSSEDSTNESRQDRRDSDSDLKDAIRRRKAEFSKTEREIEDRLAEAERSAPGGSKAASPETTDNDTQVDAKIQGRKSRFSSDNGTPPPKNNSQNSKSKRKSSTSSDSSPSDRERSTNRTRSSSTDSSSSERYKSSKKVSSHDRRSHRKHSKSSRSKRTRSRSADSRRRSRSKSRRDSRHSKKSRSRSRSRNKSHYKSSKSRKSRSRSRRRSSSRSSYGKSRRRSRSKRRSSSSSRRSHRHRRSRSSSSGRGKRSHRH